MSMSTSSNILRWSVKTFAAPPEKVSEKFLALSSTMSQKATNSIPSMVERIWACFLAIPPQPKNATLNSPIFPSLLSPTSPIFERWPSLPPPC